MGFIRKNALSIFLFIALFGLYFLFRLFSFNNLPIFTDEAIYVRWAQIALNDSNWRFISLTDGKQPLFVWFSIVFMKFIDDPLLAARSVSVFSGFFTLIGIWFLSKELFGNSKIAFLSSFLYVFYPFAEVYDRMAIMDSMVATFSVWALYFSILLVRKVRLDLAYTLGIVMGAGALTKSSNFFSFYCLPFTLLLFDFKAKDKSKRLIRWVLYAFFAIIITQIIYNVLRLSPFFLIIEKKNTTFIYTFSEWITHPLTFFMGNLYGLGDWLFGYLTVPYIILILISLIFIFKDFRKKILLFLYFIFPFIALALFGKVIFPRFIFFMSIYLLPLAAWSLNFLINISINKLKIKNVYLKSIIAFVIFVVFVTYPAFVSLGFAYDPINSRIPGADNRQYVNSWASGWGVKETVEFITNKSKDGKVFIGTEGTFGLMPASMEISMHKNENIVIKGYWPIKEFPKEALEYASKMPSYFVFYQENSQILPDNYPLELVFKKQMGNSDYYYRLYEIVPKN